MYPLKFRPVFQRRLWGGKRLRALLGKAVEGVAGPIGEAWELGDLPAGSVGVDSVGAASDGAFSSVIANGVWAGRTLHEFWKDERGKTKDERGGGDYFPLLVKFLDAEQDLSVQVHPDAAYCAGHAGAHVKSEAWYIVHAEPGARIFKGLKAGVTREAFRAALETGGGGGVEGLLRAIPVRAGDCHYLPSGTIHALGAGIVAAEVQTPSDTTFRVFDWNRLGPDGKARKLHVAEALECIDFSGGAGESGGERSEVAGGGRRVTRLVTCEHFTLQRVRTVQGFEQAMGLEEAVVMIMLEGQAVINVAGAGGGAGPTAVVRGETVLLPAGMAGARLKTVTDCAWLEARVPAS